MRTCRDLGLADVAGSTVLREDLVDGVIDVMLTWSDAHPEHAGHLLSAIATDRSVDQQAACRRLQPGGACYLQMDEQDVERVIAHPRSMIGPDGLPHDRHPHLRLWGAFPRVLARYWRERGLISASLGLTAVFVNGQRACAEAADTQVLARAGRMLRRG